MSTLSRWLAPVVLVVGFGAAALAPVPAQAQSGNDLARVLVDVADVVFRNGTPYYGQDGQYGQRDQYGQYGQDDRLIVVPDRYGRPVYYRQVARQSQFDPRSRYTDVKCNKHGKCKAKGQHYYDARYDRREDHHDNRYYSYDRDDRRDRDDDRDDDRD